MENRNNNRNSFCYKRSPAPDIFTLTKNTYFTTAAVLRMWTAEWGSEATYQRLAQALQHPAVKHSNLAAKYCHLDNSTS